MVGCSSGTETHLMDDPCQLLDLSRNRLSSEDSPWSDAEYVRYIARCLVLPGTGRTYAPINSDAAQRRLLSIAARLEDIDV